MALKDFIKRQAPPLKRPNSAAFWLANDPAFADLCCRDYVSLDKSPEVVTACRRIADMISSMTIYLMANTERGDIRIINELSRKIDIEPNRDMTRKTFIDAVVMNMLLYGHGNSVVIPRTVGGYLDALIPVPPAQVGFIPDGRSYEITINGLQYSPESLLHFVYNPDPNYPWQGQGVTAVLKDVANNLKQAAHTEKGFLSSKWKPSVIVKVDSLTDEFASPAGRQKLMDSYVNASEAGEPWLIPADQFSVEQVKPLSLADLAISDIVKLDKQTVAAILGVPAFVLGVGQYSAAEWNAFVNNTIRPIAREIEQEMTRKLILSNKMYLKFNMASLYSYDIKTTADVYSELYVRGIVTGNEVRDKLSLEPLDGLDDLVILENYIPLGKIGEQEKLVQE